MCRSRCAAHTPSLVKRPVHVSAVPWFPELITWSIEASGGRALPGPDTAQRSGEGHQGRQLPHDAPEGTRPTIGAQAGRACAASSPVPGPAGTSLLRRDTTTQHEAREDENGPHGLCTDAGEESTVPPQVKARLTVVCKSDANRGARALDPQEKCDALASRQTSGMRKGPSRGRTADRTTSQSWRSVRRGTGPDPPYRPCAGGAGFLSFDPAPCVALGLRGDFRLRVGGQHRRAPLGGDVLRRFVTYAGRVLVRPHHGRSPPRPSTPGPRPDRTRSAADPGSSPRSHRLTSGDAGYKPSSSSRTAPADPARVARTGPVEDPVDHQPVVTTGATPPRIAAGSSGSNRAHSSSVRSCRSCTGDAYGSTPQDPGASFR